MKYKKYCKHFSTYRKILFFLVCWLTGYTATAQTISGKVIDDQGSPIIGATVIIKGSNNGTTTNQQGEFSINNTSKNESLIVSSVGYKKQEIKLDNKSYLTITLKKQTNQLDETVIRAYGTTTRRLNTGDISTVIAKEIDQQPVSNPLAALEGRVPGLVVTQSNGVPGSGFKVQIRGQNSIAQGSEPLFIIDGVPYASGNDPINELNSATGINGLSPFNSINPSDIESIEVLKDADATAIYGSRGANGVILITTKKGKPGKTKFNVNVYSGISNVTRTMGMMNTRQYLMMRKEAFKNDGVVPDVNSAPDLLVWDTTRYTNFKKMLIGGTAHTTNVQASISGGSDQTQFLISGGYHHETTVFPGDLADNRGSFHVNVNHSSKDQKLFIQLTAGYSSDINNLIASDLTGYLTLPPDLPPLFDSSGKLNWQQGGVSFINPLAYLLDKYKAETDNLLSNLQISYHIVRGLEVKINTGFNTMQVNETSIIPAAAQDPAYSTSGASQFGNNNYKSWIIEPQISYSVKISRGTLNALLGTTWQQTLNSNSTINASGYSSDALLESASAASSVTIANNYSQYRYEAVFGRLNYNWKNKYVLNLTGRRDGSSRFGPGKRFSDFGAAGGAWIFSEEKFAHHFAPFISYGKLRGSYGITGNDQIGNYQYLDTWGTTNNSYQGITGLYPTKLFNPDYGWEVNRKLEGALELGFADNRVLFSASYFRNRSSNQLISYSLPAQTGFTSITENFPAVVQNTGWEFTLTAGILSTSTFQWNSSLNLTIPKNKLIAFPDLAQSSYSYTYVVGQSLSVLNVLHLNGVDPATGVFTFKDVNNDGSIDFNDYQVQGNLDPKFYGGWSNSFSFKKWELDIFLQFRNQLGANYWSSIYSIVPGTMFNQPVALLKRWQMPGDKSNIQQFTQDPGSNAYQALSLLGASSGVYGNASYVRLKNISLSYKFSASWLQKIHFTDARLYLLGQNLATLTKYQGADPETQNLYTLPPLRTITAGIQLQF